MKPKKNNEIKSDNLRDKIKVVLTSDRTEIRRSQIDVYKKNRYRC